VHDFPGCMGVKEASVANYLVSRPLKIVEIIVYNIDIIKADIDLIIIFDIVSAGISIAGTRTFLKVLSQLYFLTVKYLIFINKPKFIKKR